MSTINCDSQPLLVGHGVLSMQDLFLSANPPISALLNVHRMSYHFSIHAGESALEICRYEICSRHAKNSPTRIIGII
jgi:hypothetical protein